MSGEEAPILPYMDGMKLREDVAKQVEVLLAVRGCFRNCLTCAYFVEPRVYCKRFELPPPLRIIVYGCEEHTELIPF